VYYFCKSIKSYWIIHRIPQQNACSSDYRTSKSLVVKWLTKISCAFFYRPKANHCKKERKVCSKSQNGWQAMTAEALQYVWLVLRTSYKNKEKSSAKRTHARTINQYFRIHSHSKFIIHAKQIFHALYINERKEKYSLFVTDSANVLPRCPAFLKFEMKKSQRKIVHDAKYKSHGVWRNQQKKERRHWNQDERIIEMHNPPYTQFLFYLLVIIVTNSS